jgi:site-specific recombinase XerD
MFEEGVSRKGEGSVDSTTLVGSSVVKLTQHDNEEEENIGSVSERFGPGTHDDEVPRQATPRKGGSAFSRRCNDKGQQFVQELFRRYDLEGVGEWFFRSIEESTLRNYRRGFTVFVSLLEQESLDINDISDSKSALAALVRVLKAAFVKDCKLSSVRIMKTAMVRVFSFVFNVDLGQSSVLKAALRYYTIQKLPKKEPVRLNWNIDQLFNYLKGLKKFTEMDFDLLTAVAASLCMSLTALRFTELLQLWVFDSEPNLTDGNWKLYTHVKNHDYIEPVWLHTVDDEHLNPVSALCELRERVRSWYAGQNKMYKTLWHKLVNNDLIPLSYDDLRSSVRSILRAAGIDDNRPYHIKHAALTSLNERGASANELANFARHKHGSMVAYQNYVSNDGGKRSVERLIYKDLD